MRRKLLWRHPAWCGDEDSFGILYLIVSATFCEYPGQGGYHIFDVSGFCITPYRLHLGRILDRADTTFSMYRDFESHCIGFIWDASSTGRIPHLRCIGILYHTVSVTICEYPAHGGYRICYVSVFRITLYQVEHWVVLIP